MAASHRPDRPPAGHRDRHGGGHQLKLNKAAESDTASLLFQSGWEGRAEFGLTGSDDVAIKVSPDGSTWHTSLTLDRNNGGITTTGDLKIAGAVNVYTDAANPTGTNVEGLRIQPNGQMRASNTDAALVLNRTGGVGTVVTCRAGGAYVGGVRVEPGELGLTTPGRLSFITGAGEAMSVAADGKVGVGLAPAAPLHVKDLMRLEPAAAPAPPAAGDIYFDAATSKLRCHDGAGWHDLF